MAHCYAIRMYMFVFFALKAIPAKSARIHILGMVFQAHLLLPFNHGCYFAHLHHTHHTFVTNVLLIIFSGGLFSSLTSGNAVITTATLKHEMKRQYIKNVVANRMPWYCPFFLFGNR